MSMRLIFLCVVLCLGLTACQNSKNNSSYSSLDSINSSNLFTGLAAQVSYEFDYKDEQLAQQALESNFTHQPKKWPSSDYYVEVVPVATFKDQQGGFCRRYSAKLISNDAETSVQSSACRQQNGHWLYQK